MAQTIITLCDYCLAEQDTQVGGLPYRVGVNLPGESRWGWTEVDLCPDHAEGLSDLALMLAKYGRAFQPEGQPSLVLTCPDCGRTYESRSGLDGHRRKKHDSTTREPRPCPECPRTFDTPQGLSMHIRRTHQGFDPNAGRT